MSPKEHGECFVLNVMRPAPNSDAQPLTDWVRTVVRVILTWATMKGKIAIFVTENAV